MSAIRLPIEFIVQDPEVRGGRPIISGSSIRVSDIAAYHIYDGMVPEELALQFGLTLSQVHAALAYYFDHREAIDAEIRSNQEEAESWRRQLERGQPHPTIV
ncbi:MAG: DUF433 domain-containing protein [Acidobacteria bacterium]|nr:DUF433 domain-containing protein [Acidobacteriota bacterium]